MKVVSPKMTELFHGIRSQLTALLDGLDPKDLATMSLGLSHSLSRCALTHCARTGCIFSGRADSSSSSLRTRWTPWSYKQSPSSMTLTRKSIFMQCVLRLVYINSLPSDRMFI